MNEVNSRLKPAAGGSAFSVCTVANVVLALVAVLILRAARIGEDSDVYKYISYLVAPAAVAAGCALVLKFYRQPVKRTVGFACSPVYFAIALLVVFGLVFCVSKINPLTLGFFKLMGYEPRAESSYLPSLQGWLVLPAVLVIAVIPAVTEEFLFRGVILSCAGEGMGDVAAIFTAGLCFSLFHANPEQTVYQFICGCVFAFITVRSGSVLPAFAMHLANNAFIISVYAAGYSSLPMSAEADIAITVLGGIAFAAGILWLALIKKPFKKGIKGGAAAFYLAAGVGIALNVLMWILSFTGV